MTGACVGPTAVRDAVRSGFLALNGHAEEIRLGVAQRIRGCLPEVEDGADAMYDGLPACPNAVDAMSSGPAPLVGASPIRVADPLDKDVAASLLSPVDRVALGRRDGARSLGVGLAYCVVALGAPLDEHSSVGHWKLLTCVAARIGGRFAR